MKKIHSLEDLKIQILYLETIRDKQEVELKTAFNDTMESMRLSAIIKKTAKDLASSPEFKSDLVNAGMGLTAGYLSKRLAFGKKGGVIKWLFGNILQMGVSKIVSTNADSIKSGGMGIIQSLFRKKQDTTEHETEEEPVEQTDGN